jgi:hypothetical protein
MKKLKLITLLGIAAALSLSLFACNSNGSPKAAFDAYVSGAVSKNAEKLAGALYAKDSDEYNQVVDTYKKQFESEQYKDAKITFKIKDFKATEDGDSATATVTIVEYTVKDKDDNELVPSITDKEVTGLKFTKTDGKWYLNLASFNPYS